MSLFKGVKAGRVVEAFHLVQVFLKDTFPDKVDVIIGAYKDENGKPWVFPVVRKVEKQMAEDPTLDHEYLPVLGLDKFRQLSVGMLLGENSPAILSGCAFGVQTVSGNGALRIGAEFLVKHLKYHTFYNSDPTFPNHENLFLVSGFTNSRTYRYWNAKSRSLDFEGLIEDLKKAPENSVIVLHVCGHNPTGMDLSQEQWEMIADVMEERKLFPFFDSAYQGFASGDHDKDAWAVRYFVKRGFELFCAQSFSKNFGLYGERVGNLTLVVKDPNVVAPIRSQLTWIVRGMYSSPPAHGARVVARVLSDKQLFEEWSDTIKFMSARAKQMRHALRDELVKLGTPGNWDHIINQIGLFSYTGLSEKQSMYLIDKYHIYLLKSGRISICGLNPSNVTYVARAIHETISKFPEDQ